MAYCNSIDEIASSSPSSSLILAGDFNIPSYNDNACVCATDDRAKRDLIVNMAELHFLDQMNHVRNFRQVTLDLVFSNIKPITVYPAEDPLVPADQHHPPLSFSLSTGKGSSPVKYFACPNLRKCNLLAASEMLSTVDLYSLCNQSSIQGSFKNIVSLLGDFCVACSPLKRIGSSPFPKWFSKELINMVIQKKIAHKRYKLTFSPVDYSHFSVLREACRNLSRACYRSYLHHVETSIPHNPNSFWSFVRSSGEAPGIPSKVSLGDRSSKDLQERADMFSEYFSSVFSQPVVSPPSFDFSTLSSLAGISFSVLEVSSALQQLDTKKGAGPDNITPAFLKSSSETLAGPLTILFNKSLLHGIFPEILKIGHIVPILKSGDSSKVENYRPITILSSLGKIFDSLVLSRLKFFFKPLVCPCQHGFTSSRSTVTNLLLFEESILSAMRAGKQLDVAFVDFAKAFDKVDHSILICKLEAYGIHGPLLSWLSDYLRDRRLRVKLPGLLSKEFHQVSGVPQGSLLGPYLFIVFINDIVSSLHVEALLFADDVKIFTMVSSDDDFIRLQASIDCVMDWCITNNMKLNFSKCSVMTFGRLRCPLLFQYTLEGRPLKRVFSIKDLGVTFTADLSFHEHVYDLCKRAHRMLGYIFRSTRGMTSPVVLKTLYSSFVRQLLEYASPVWSPYQVGSTSDLEAVQRKFLRLVGIRQGLRWTEVPLADLQADLHLLDLQFRREVADVVFLAKLIDGLLDCPMLLNQVDFRTPSGTRSLDLFGRRHYSRGYDFHSPLARMMRLGNQFCHTVDFFHENTSSIRRRVLEDIRRRTLEHT